MTAEDLLSLVDPFTANNLTVWLDGGWAVDAALGDQTRTHDDLDVVVDLREADALRSVLESRDFVVATGCIPTSFEMVDEEGRQVDVHPIRFTATGDGLYRMESGADWAYPAAGLGWKGTVGGRNVRCLAPEVQMLCHTGYEPHVSSYDDVWALSRRFGIAVPAEYMRPRASYPVRS